MLVLGLCGSLRRDSHSRRLLAAAGRELPSEAEFAEWPGLARLPPYSQDVDVAPLPRAVNEFRGELTRADAVLIATPEYNHSVPGQLKNALDWASRPFPHNALRGKSVAVIGASTGLFGAVWAQAEVRKVLGAIGARVIDEELAVASAYEAFETDGSLRDPELRAGLADILEQVLRSARAPQGQAAVRVERTSPGRARQPTRACVESVNWEFRRGGQCERERDTGSPADSGVGGGPGGPPWQETDAPQSHGPDAFQSHVPDTLSPANQRVTSPMTDDVEADSAQSGHSWYASLWRTLSETTVPT